MKRLIKQKLHIIILSCLLCVSSLWAQEVKRIVSADRAFIYAEPSEQSSKIDTVRRGTVLTLFQKGIEESEWLYVTFQSQRWKGEVTGFIKAELVVTEEEMQRQMEEAEKPAEAAQEQKPGEVTEQPEEKAQDKAKAETKAQDELPDLRAAFAKPKPAEPAPVKAEETKETEQSETVPVVKEEAEKIEPAPIMPEVKEEEKKEAEKVEESKPEPETINKEEVKEIEPSAVIAEEKKEIEEPESVPLVKEEPTQTIVKEGVTESPQGREVSVPVKKKPTESEPYAIKKEEIPTAPPPTLKPEEKIEEEAKEIAESQTYAIIEMEIPQPPKVEETPELQPKTETLIEPAPKEEPTTPPEKAELTEKSETPEEKEEIKEEAPPEEPEKEEILPEAEKEEPQVVKPPEQIVQPTELARPKIPEEVGLLSFGLGYGPSWGGLGGSLQLNTKAGFSIHAGVGMYPTKTSYSEFDWVRNETLYSIGIKYYLPFEIVSFRPYVDLMYGGISVEAVQLVKEIWYNEYTFENIQKTLYGPSLMAGVELRLGFIAANASLGLSYNTTSWDYWDRDYFLNFGLGFVFYF
jgi:hypothetical protein